MTLLSLVCALAAFAALGWATDAHHRRWRGVPPDAAAKRQLRLAAWIALGASFFLAVLGRGWIFGPVVWSGLVMLSAGAVFLLLNFASPAGEPRVPPSTRKRTNP